MHDSGLVVVIAFSISVIGCTLILLSRGLHEKFTADFGVSIQSVHAKPVPRVGGLAILLSTVMSYWIASVWLEWRPPSDDLGYWWVVIFLIGFWEDIAKNLSPRTRFMLIFLLCAAFLIVHSELQLTRIGIQAVDDYWIVHPALPLLISAFAMAGLINGFNIIDGMNGLSTLSAGGCLIILWLAGYNGVSNSGDPLTVIYITALGGFLLFNFPVGRIFLGDGGAYLCGFFVSHTLLHAYSSGHDRFSSFFILLCVILPTTDTLFSIARRYYNGTGISSADANHIHTLVKRYLDVSDSFPNLANKNALASCCVLIPTFVIQSIGLVSPGSNTLCALLCLLYFIFYSFSYGVLRKKTNQLSPVSGVVI